MQGGGVIMRIGDSSISMSAKSTYTEKQIEQESLKFWVGNRPDFESQKFKNLNLEKDTNAVLKISDEGKKELKKCEDAKVEDDTMYELSSEDKHKIRLIESFIRIFTGKKVKLNVLDKIKTRALRKTSEASEGMPIKGDVQKTAGWGLEYDYTKHYYEKQTMTFSANGTVKTSDGRNIDFKIDLEMKREYTSYENKSIRAGDAKVIDPLVINLDNTFIKLTDNKVNFDLDFDGKIDQVSFASEGSGFLALDLNEDGVINNGRELFGPKSGDGFSELAKYDSDSNNWIDENDAVFSKLKIWMKDESGEDMLFSLAEKGVGALYIGNVNTTFSLKDSSNNLSGEIQKTGVFLRENGTAGIIQHIDLAI